MITTATTKSSSSSKSSTSWHETTSAVGPVDDLTQKNYDKYKTDYKENQKVTDAYNKLQNTINAKPTEFKSTHKSAVDSLYDQIVNRKEFEYDLNSDPMYQMYKDQYTQRGKNAMQDAQAQAAANTGGFGSSYATTAGQQMYQSYVDQLNEKVPDLWQQSYDKYQDETNELYNRYGVTKDAYDTDYREYRDTVGDWQDDRQYDFGDYTDTRDFDYGQFVDSRDYWQNEYWQQRYAVMETFGESETTTKSSSKSTTTYSYS